MILLKSCPDVVLSQFEVAPQDIDRLPAARAHDCCRVVTGAQQVLSCPHSHRMAAERVDVDLIEPREDSTLLDQTLDGSRAQASIDGYPLVDGAKQKFVRGSPPLEPLTDQGGG